MERHYTGVRIAFVSSPDGARHHVYTPFCSCGWVSPYAWQRRADADNDADEHVSIMAEGR